MDNLAIVNHFHDLFALINSERIGIGEQFCDDQKVPYCQVLRIMDRSMRIFDIIILGYADQLQLCCPKNLDRHSN
jgi:hypothetical protein